MSDHDRPLNERGRRDAPALGAWLDEHITWSEQAPLVLVSTARRAQLTWGLARSAMSERWDAAEIRDEARIYEASVPTIVAVLNEATDGSPAAGTVIIVGHNPGVAGLVHVCGRPSALRDEATGKFPTSAVAVLVNDGAIADGLAGGFEVQEFAVPRG